jgi:hypothetical protein
MSLLQELLQQPRRAAGLFHDRHIAALGDQPERDAAKNYQESLVPGDGEEPVLRPPDQKNLLGYAG